MSRGGSAFAAGPVVAGRVDALSAEAGRHPRRSGGWRSAMIVYVLSLHSLAFLILAVRALTAAPGSNL